MIKAGIVGAAGYTGGELIRILSSHPNTEIAFCQSNSQTGKRISEIHPGCFHIDDRFVGEISDEVDIIFLCMGHGRSREFMSKHRLDSGIKLIDLSQDFRIKNGHKFVYGLPEIYREKIRESNFIANPGCFATCIQLGLLPAIANGKIDNPIHVTGITGSTGAGQSPSPTTHFSWRNSNVSVYKAFKHQHLREINQTFSDTDSSFDQKINFVPIRGNFTRGILSSIYSEVGNTAENWEEIYLDFYRNHPSVHVIDQNPDVKMVNNTNLCLLNVKIHDGILHVISVIDNLVKGASGQAVQNMNLMFGLDEMSGLNIKGTVF